MEPTYFVEGMQSDAAPLENSLALRKCVNTEFLCDRGAPLFPSLSPSPFFPYSFQLSTLECKLHNSPGLLCLVVALSLTSGTEFGTWQELHVFLLSKPVGNRHTVVIKSTASGVTLHHCEFRPSSSRGTLLLLLSLFEPQFPQL